MGFHADAPWEGKGQFWQKGAPIVKYREALHCLELCNKSSAAAEMGDRGQNRHGPKRGGGLLCPFRGELGPRLIQCGLGRGLLPYQVAHSSI